MSNDCFFWICGGDNWYNVHSLDLSDDPSNEETRIWVEELDGQLQSADWGEGEKGTQESLSMNWPDSGDCRCFVDGQEYPGFLEDFSDGDGGFTWQISGTMCECKFPCHPT